MPGIAVDAQDNIWTFTRAKPPVQVYRPDGKLVRAWGDDTIGSAHHIKIDRTATSGSPTSACTSSASSAPAARCC